MNVDLALDDFRIELGFNCDDEASALALFERLKTMIADGVVNFQLSMPDGSAPALADVDDGLRSCAGCGASVHPADMDGDHCLGCAEDLFEAIGLPL